ncbi:MAG: hypothetical protein IT368_07425 [Candidatus Hydrogenedentes bacterium]|nr:hypothetical protein [Candidatus Hydrogenedentota bacterium]
MKLSQAALEKQLNHFDAEKRQHALQGLLEQVENGTITLPAADSSLNLHCHSFYSYNGYGWSPSFLAWKGRVEGLYAMGIVDFDVLDGVEEFLGCCAQLGLRACASLETRIFVPQFSDRVINSPGEPGIAYHMGVGFISGDVKNRTLLDGFSQTAQARTRDLVERVNKHLDPVELDYERDVLTLTPAGNATERHVCAAYAAKTASEYPDDEERTAFWASRLQEPAAVIAKVLYDPPKLEALIRAKTMKRGGAGYVQPEGPDFPRLETFNAFVMENGAIPTFAWLDGTSAGEQAIGELLDVMQDAGVALVNIIPDRNWNIKDAAERERKVRHLYDFVAEARDRDLPVIVGTEMNAYGQRFVDDFEAPELQPLVDDFRTGANVVYAHTRLQALGEMGLLSDWSAKAFHSARDRNAWYARFGAALSPEAGLDLSGIHSGMSPDEVLFLAGR